MPISIRSVVGRIVIGLVLAGAGVAGFAAVTHAQTPLGARITERVHSTLEEFRVMDHPVSRLSTQPETVPGEILVKFEGSQTFERRTAAPFVTTEGALRAYRVRSDVLYAEPNYVVHALSAPDDPYYPYQWNFDNTVNRGIHMNDVWGNADGGGVVVAVVDTGVAYEDYQQGSRRYYQAPDLAGTAFVAGYDFINDDNHPNDDQGHGTHVAGTIAQSTGNGLGVAGIAPKAVIMPVKVLGKYGSGTYADVANGIRWAADHGAKVINLSLGGPAASQTLFDAVAYAHDRGALVVAAAGNDGQAALSYPAAYSQYVVSVGATRFDETRTAYSSYGNGLTLVAPGGDTSVDQNGDGYGDGILQQTFGGSTNNWGYYFYQGTSMAAPHVSAVAALVFSKGLAATPDGVRSILEGTADDLGPPGYDTEYGYGLLNAAQAIVGTSTSPGGSLPPGGTPPPGETPQETPAHTIHIADITLTLSTRWGGRYCKANASVAVVNQDGAKVADATVSGAWSGAAQRSVSGSTNGSGVVSFSSGQWVRCDTFTFTVDSVTKDGWEYTPADNTETSDSISP